MEADLDLAEQLLTRAGALLEDASVIAIVKGDHSLADRLDLLRDALQHASMLTDAAAVCATSQA